MEKYYYFIRAQSNLSLSRGRLYLSARISGIWAENCLKIAIRDRYRSWGSHACGGGAVARTYYCLQFDRLCRVIIAHELLPLLLSEETKALLAGKPVVRARARRRIARDLRASKSIRACLRELQWFFIDSSFQRPAAGISSRRPSWQSRLIFIWLLYAGCSIISAFGEPYVPYRIRKVPLS